jgi:predicted transposase YbfD/YdcC
MVYTLRSCKEKGGDLAKQRMNRRMVGLAKARLPDLRLENIKDPRKARGKRWDLGVLLKTCIVGLVSRCQSLAEVESLTDEMGSGMKQVLGLRRRLPDTTLRDVLVQVSPSELRKCLHRQVKAAHRRKALQPEQFPFGVVAIDGKSVTLDAWDRRYAQRHLDASGDSAVGLLRTLTCSLVSSASKVCIDAVPIPSHTNEMGHFASAFTRLCQVFGRKFFRLASMDAGMCSLENADLIVSQRRDYLFSLKADQPTLQAEAERLLAHQWEPVAQTLENRGKVEVHRRLYLSEEMAGFLNWRHLQTVLRVESVSQNLETGECESESRYFISSLKSRELKPEQWLAVVRNHWSVENHCHWTWDAVFREDERPWIRMEPKGALVVMLLRRMAFNLLSLFRSVTQRSESQRQIPWKDLMRWMYIALLNVEAHEVALLRSRPPAGG